MTFIRILELGEKEIKSSLDSGFKDFEDGVQNFCAIRAKMKIILTRNLRDYKLSELAILNPSELIAKLTNED